MSLIFFRFTIQASLRFLFLAGLVFVCAFGVVVQAEAQTGPSLSPDVFVYPRHAGKPDPRWRDFEWRFVEREASGVKYRLFFDAAESLVAEITLPMIEAQIGGLSTRFGAAPKETFDYILFTSLEEFRQANIFFVDEGVRGITSTTEATMALPFNGDPVEFRHVGTHEMVHQFQVQNALSDERSGDFGVLQQVPLWFIEGMAEYESLGGSDPELRAYMRDLLFNKNDDLKYRMPRLFEEGLMSFVFIYKVGHAKIDFFERAFGSGTALRIYKSVLDDRAASDFETVVSRAVGRSVEDLEKMWNEYLVREYVEPAAQLRQTAASLKEVPGVGSELDLFDLSPDGSTLLVREVDPLTGVSWVRVMDAQDGGHKTDVLRDRRGDIVGLSFFQAPTIAISSRDIAIIVQTPEGPVLELRSYTRTGEGFSIGPVARIQLTDPKLLAAWNPTFNFNGSQMAFVGLHSDGSQSVRIVDVASQMAKEVSREHYAWRSLAWSRNPAGREILIGSTNRSEPYLFNLFRYDPERKNVERIGVSAFHQTAASVEPRESSGSPEEIVFRSTASGSPQIHWLDSSGERRITAVQTMADRPILRGDHLYFLILRSGRFRLIRLARSDLVTDEPPIIRLPPPADQEPWKLQPEALKPGETKIYRPFYTSGWRLDSVGAFISGSSSGLALQASDLMRNYQVDTWLVSPDNPDQGLAEVSFSSRRGRSTWSVGMFRTSQWRVRPELSESSASSDGASSNTTNTNDTNTNDTSPDASSDVQDWRSTYYRHQEWGVLGSYEYPLSLFTRLGLGGRLASVSRSNIDTSVAWSDPRPERDLLVSPSIWYGFDQVNYEPIAGPIEGASFLAEAGVAWTSGSDQTYQRVRLDAAAYFPLFQSRTVFGLEGIAGAVAGSGDRDPFFLWSDDILRAYNFGDRRLLGDFVAAAKAELKFPIGSAFGFPNLRGLAAFDYGSVARKLNEMVDNRASSISFGLGLSLPPLVLEVTRSFAQRTAPWREADSAPPSGQVLHVRITYLYE